MTADWYLFLACEPIALLCPIVALEADSAFCFNYDVGSEDMDYEVGKVKRSRFGKWPA